MNSADIKISKAVWKVPTANCEQAPLTISTDETAEVLTLTFEPPLQKGSGTLFLEFTGSINDKMKGFYRSKFKGPDGQDKYNGVTQFEATGILIIFYFHTGNSIIAFAFIQMPDELFLVLMNQLTRPRLTCKLIAILPLTFHQGLVIGFFSSLIVDKNKTALSNMPVKEIQQYPGNDQLHVVKYDRSPVMSTYLVAFCIGDFEYVETTSADGVLCRVYTPPGKKDQGKFALSVTEKVLPYYKEYFGVA